jgi:hypothetical protein
MPIIGPKAAGPKVRAISAAERGRLPPIPRPRTAVMPSSARLVGRSRRPPSAITSRTIETA